MRKMHKMTYHRSSAGQQLPNPASQIASFPVTQWFAKLSLTFSILTLFCVQTEASLILYFARQTSDKCDCGILLWLQEPLPGTGLQRIKHIVFYKAI